MFIVVRISECRISCFCTPIGLPVESSHVRLGTLAELPTREDALSKVARVKRDVRLQAERTVVTVAQLIDQYREERMPTRASTARGYNAWLKNHVLPRWGGARITALQPRDVELWLQSLKLSPKSKVHIRGQLSILLDYAQWRGYLPVGRNAMELVAVQRASKRTRKVRSLSTEQFQALLAQFEVDLCWRTLLLLAVSFGLRVSEVLGLKWSDVDWLLHRTISIERGVVKQIVDSVKSDYSAARHIPAHLLGANVPDAGPLRCPVQGCPHVGIAQRQPSQFHRRGKHPIILT